MKTLKLVFIVVLTTALFIVCQRVKATDHHGHGDGSLYSGASDKWHGWNDDDKQATGSNSGSGNSGSTNLPVNDYVWALVIFGAALGAKVITDKIKFAKN